MGIHGMGKAFNLQYAQRGTIQPGNVRVRGGYNNSFFAPQPFQQTTTIQYNNGPSGFWGFMSGFLNGIGSGGNMFGMGNVGGLGGQSQNQVDYLGNLRTLGGDKWSIVDDGNGKFRAVKKDGSDTITGSYKEVADHITKPTSTSSSEVQGNKPATENQPAGQNPPKTEDKPTDKPTAYTSPGGSDWGAAKGDDLKDGVKINVYDDRGDTITSKTTEFSSDKVSTDIGEFPQTITINGKRYELSVSDTNSKGVAIYESKDGKGDKYRLEKNGDSVQLNQYQSEDSAWGAGTADITSK